MMEDMQENLLTIQEAAAMIGVAEAVIRTAALNGRLPFLRRCLRCWISSADLYAYQKRTQET